jgi:hypothetical protein
MNARVDPHANGEQTNAPIFPNPDVVQLKRFADVLFKHAAPVGFVSLRGFQHRDRATTFINPISLGDPQFMDVDANGPVKRLLGASRRSFVLRWLRSKPARVQQRTTSLRG